MSKRFFISGIDERKRPFSLYLPKRLLKMVANATVLSKRLIKSEKTSWPTVNMRSRSRQTKAAKLKTLEVPQGDTQLAAALAGIVGADHVLGDFEPGFNMVATACHMQNTCIVWASCPARFLRLWCVPRMGRRWRKS